VMDQGTGADFGGANEQRGRRRTGRRAKPQAAGGEDAAAEVSSEGAEAPAAPKQGGWGDAAASNESTFAIPQVQEMSNDIEYMDSIPTLDDDNEPEDMTLMVAEPSKVTATQNRMISLGELNHSKAFVLPRSADIGMDLSILMSGLSLQNQINEVDEPWTVEGLMREIQEDLQLERDKIEDAASA